MMIPHDLRERLAHHGGCAREFGVEVRDVGDNGYWLFDCHPHPGSETVVRASTSQGRRSAPAVRVGRRVPDIPVMGVLEPREGGVMVYPEKIPPICDRCPLTLERGQKQPSSNSPPGRPARHHPAHKQVRLVPRRVHRALVNPPQREADNDLARETRRAPQRRMRRPQPTVLRPARRTPTRTHRTRNAKPSPSAPSAGQGGVRSVGRPQPGNRRDLGGKIRTRGGASTDELKPRRQTKAQKAPEVRRRTNARQHRLDGTPMCAACETAWENALYRKAASRPRKRIETRAQHESRRAIHVPRPPPRRHSQPRPVGHHRNQRRPASTRSEHHLFDGSVIDLTTATTADGGNLAASRLHHLRRRLHPAHRRAMGHRLLRPAVHPMRAVRPHRRRRTFRPSAMA